MSTAETKNPIMIRSRKRRRKRNRNEAKMYNIAQKAITDRERKEVEMKAYDYETGLRSPTTAGEIRLLTLPDAGIAVPSVGIIQGTAENERVGDTISVKSQLIRFSMLFDDPNNYIRIIIFRWLCAGDPTVATVLQFPTSPQPWLSPILRNSSNRVQVLYDNLYGLSSNSNSNIVEKVYLKQKFKITWQNDGTNEKGNVYCLMVTDSFASGPNTFISYRVRYTDS